MATSYQDKRSEVHDFINKVNSSKYLIEARKKLGISGKQPRSRKRKQPRSRKRYALQYPALSRPLRPRSRKRKQPSGWVDVTIPLHTATAALHPTHPH